jgi:hypothetical protein
MFLKKVSMLIFYHKMGHASPILLHSNFVLKYIQNRQLKMAITFFLFKIETKLKQNIKAFNKTFLLRYKKWQNCYIYKFRIHNILLQLFDKIICEFCSSFIKIVL